MFATTRWVGAGEALWLENAEVSSNPGGGCRAIPSPDTSGWVNCVRRVDSSVGKGRSVVVGNSSTPLKARSFILKKQLYRSLFENAPDGIVVVNSRGVIEDVNPAACAMFGYDLDALRDQPIEILVPESAAAAHRGHRDRFLESDPRPRPMGAGLELLGRRRDGSTFPAEISLSPLVDGGGAIATVRDVSLRKRMQDFSIGALRAAEEVRASIARDLHDDTAQQLAALMIQLKLLERATTAEERGERTAIIRDGLEAASDGIRRTARGLRPPELEDAGLAAALAAHARQLRDAHALEIEIDAEPVDALLTPDSLLVLYRIVQEAMTNVANHAGVDRARVVVAKEKGLVLAEVSDEGAGFVMDLTSGEGLGLLGMHERAAMIGGRLTVTARPGAGTRVRFSLPIDLEREANRV